MPCGSDVLGRRRVSMSKEPSSSFGMNSVPRHGTDASAATSRTDGAADDDGADAPSAQSSSPRYAIA